MTTRTAFNAEDWSTIATAPYLIAMLIIGASRGGRMRETLAIAEAYAAARQHYKNELLQQIFTTSPSIDPTAAGHDADALHDQAMTTLRRAVSLLERTATETEVNTYKRFVYYLADLVARAHREGSFLGIGGQEISDTEQAVLDEVATLFDEPPAGAGSPGADAPGGSPGSDTASAS